MFTSVFVVLSVAVSALANIFVTAPVASTTCAGGSTCNIAWEDDGTTPSLASFGLAEVSVYVGNALQQTMVQSITTSVNVSSTEAIQFTVNPADGTNGDMYFIRFQSLALADATNPTFPALAFSSRFTMTGMTGSFNASVEAEISGTTTAPIAGPTAAVTPTGASGLTTSTTKSSTSSTSSAKPSSSAASSAEGLVISGAAGLAGAAVAFFGLLL